MSAEILAMGPFQSELVKYLPFPPEFYEGTREGAIVFQSLFCCGWSTESRAMADCFRIDPWDFNQHKLDPYRVDSFELRPRLEDGFLAGEDEGYAVNWSFDVAAEWEKYVAFRDAGFDFYFLPNA